MGLCFAPDCNHTNLDGCKMYNFPADPTLKKKWEDLIRRADRVANKFSLVCSCHFVDGKKENLPTIFERNVKKKFQFHSPEKRSRTRKRTGLSVQSSKSSKVIESPVELGEPSTSKEQPPKQTSSEATLELGLPSTSLSTCVSTSTSIQLKCNCTILEAENTLLKSSIDKLEAQLEQKTPFSFHFIKHDDSLIVTYTGLPNLAIFMALYNYVSVLEINYYEGWEVKRFSRMEQLFITLMKLRLNLLHKDLAVRYQCSVGTISNIFLTWMHVLHEALFKAIIVKKIPSRNKNRTCLPTAFSTFTHCRIVLDCTEIYTHVPERLDKQKAVYSNYKHRTTLKGLIGVSPNATITFISDLYVGGTSDKKIVQHSGLIDHLEKGDLVLADKGFLISDILPSGVSLNIPPFLMSAQGGQFTPMEIQQTTKIARARIHVERAIERIKKYRILKLIPQNMRSFSSKIFQVCCALTNLQSPLIKDIEELFAESGEE